MIPNSLMIFFGGPIVGLLLLGIVFRGLSKTVSALITLIATAGGIVVGLIMAVVGGFGAILISSGGGVPELFQGASEELILTLAVGCGLLGGILGWCVGRLCSGFLRMMHSESPEEQEAQKDEKEEE